MRELGFDPEWAQMVETDYEQTMERLWDSIETDDGDLETPSGEPFCGCQICVTRETLWLVMSHAVAGYEADKVWLE